jgi:Ca2+-binding RTX toxin-like protein
MTAIYNFTIDNFKVTKNGITVQEDPFSNGTPPPSGPEINAGAATSYSTLGTFTETGGRAVMDGASSVASGGITPGSPVFSFHGAVLLTNIDPLSPLGLKSNSDFTVEGTFDLTLPDDKMEAYGIRLSDRTPDQSGDDIMELLVRRGTDNVVYVQLREFDFVNGETTVLSTVALNAGSNDQIALKLAHDAGLATTGIVTASFDLMTGGAVTSHVDLTGTGRIFGTETPDFAGDDENWTLAQFLAFSPDPSAPTSNTIEGDENNNILAGTNLIDSIFGFAGDDRLVGKEGNDVLRGAEGHDILNGGGGADDMFGGSGNDVYIVDNAGDETGEIVGGTDQGGSDLVKSSVDWTLGDGLEILTLTGSAANGTGNAASNKLFGNLFANTLSGLGSNDILIGGGGGDTLNGGAGRDVMTGGADADHFVFQALSDSVVGGGRDLIKDFVIGSDIIDLADIDANTLLADDQAFTFIGAGGFTHTAGELQAKAFGANTLVSGDVDGNGKADFQILLSGSVALQATDFLL